MESRFGALDGSIVDVLVVGGGSVGVGTTLALASRGATVVLVEKNDFASGTSARTTRIMNTGLLYLAPNNTTFWQLLAMPRLLARAVREASRFMRGRTGFAREKPHLVRRSTSCYPIYRQGRYRGWQLDLAFKLLRLCDPGGYPLNYRRLSKDAATALPLLRWLRAPDELEGVAVYTEIMVDWPERLFWETVLEARALGATALNHTLVSAIDRAADGSWQVRLKSVASDETVALHARSIVNAGGPWIDEVNAVVPGAPGRTVVASKGTHIAVQLPEECRDFGVVTTDRLGRPFTIVPFRGLHCLGPTWDPYEGDPDAARPTADEVDGLIAEANFILPGAKLTREHVRLAWTGLRPYAFDPDRPQGRRGLELHDLTASGPPFFAVTGSALTTYSGTGEMVCEVLAGRLSLNGPRAARRGPWEPMPVLRGADGWAEAARHGDVRTLADVLFRRTGEGWNADLGLGCVDDAAATVAGILGWDARRRDDEVERYRAYVRDRHLVH